MATIFKSLLENDKTSTRTLLHEAIPLTGTIVSGTYGTFKSETNVKNYSHGMFQSVFDYPHLSSSANHIFDLSVGYANSSNLSASANVQNAKKINIYNQMAQVLMGHDTGSNIQLFDEDGNLTAGGTKIDSCFFVNFARLLTKDEIKKGTFSIELGMEPTFSPDATSTPMDDRIKITDKNAQNDFRVNSPAGEYGILMLIPQLPRIF